MRDIKIAYRYAKSLLGIALEQNSLEELHNDMQLVNTTCIQNNELVLLLRNPIIKGDKKHTILNAIFDKKISTISHSFINIIVTKKREGLLADIATAFINIYKEHKNIKTAYVTTAIPLSNSQKEKIIELLKSTYKATIDLQETIDKDIIGGMILRVGDNQIDESIKRKINNLEMEFKKNLYVKEY